MASILPFVSVIVPMLNEERYITQCLLSLLSQDYPADRFEIIVADGGSEDASVRLVRQLGVQHSKIRLIPNPRRLASSGLNEGIRHAEGEIIARLDAHCRAPADYLSLCVQYLLSTGADNVGGVINAVGTGFWGRVIAVGTTSPFGVGNSSHRCSRSETSSEPGWPGAYWKRTLIAMDGFDETVGPNDDDDLSFRLIRDGKRLFLTPEIRVTHFCRSSLPSLWRQYYRYGYWKVRLIQKHRTVIAMRHLVPTAFVVALVLGSLFAVGGFPFPLMLTAIGYGAVNTGFAIWAAAHRGWWHLFGLPVVFSVLHLSYGTGVLFGALQVSWGVARRARTPANG
jgi:glycosyltransferase involved in cell wall biosynthesis